MRNDRILEILFKTLYITLSAAIIYYWYKYGMIAITFIFG